MIEMWLVLEYGYCYEIYGSLRFIYSFVTFKGNAGIIIYYS